MLSRPRGSSRQATAKTIQRAIVHGGLFGGLWGAMPVLAFPGAPPPAQLLVGCLTAGMMCAGGFVLATVPLAGMSYVLLVAAGGFFALLQEGSPVFAGMTALMVVYTAVVIVNLNWNAFLFVGHFLAEAQVQKEIAERDRVQAQAAHADRMIALGELAGGIAHDVNNVLQAIGGEADLIERHCADPDEIRRLARIVLRAVERGGAISRRLLAFARRDTLASEPMDPAAMLNGVCELLNDTLGPHIVLHVELAPELAAIRADKTQLETVLLSLATNARDAMPEGGNLTFSAAPETLTQDRGDARLRAGCYVRIGVADTGTGMDAATLLHATEPFFTTKPRGRGTGLGLSMAQGFAEQSGGALSIRTEPGHGTTITIWLPRTNIVGTPQLETDASTGPATVPQHCGRHVLVVDDDELVREVVVMSLAEAGFATAGAEDASHALAYLDQGRAGRRLDNRFLHARHERSRPDPRSASAQANLACDPVDGPRRGYRSSALQCDGRTGHRIAEACTPGRARGTPRGLHGPGHPPSGGTKLAFVASRSSPDTRASVRGRSPPRTRRARRCHAAELARGFGFRRWGVLPRGTGPLIGYTRRPPRGGSGSTLDRPADFERFCIVGRRPSV